jgi:hypothetical protein
MRMPNPTSQSNGQLRRWCFRHWIANSKSMPLDAAQFATARRKRGSTAPVRICEQYVSGATSNNPKYERADLWDRPVRGDVGSGDSPERLQPILG